MRRPLSLRRQFLGIVVVGAVLPLAALGLWLSRSAVRSGETLLRSQLELALGRQADEISARWIHRRSDVALLAENQPVRLALARGVADTAPSYLAQAFATMPALQSAVIRDASGHALWTLGDRPTELGGRQPIDPLARTPVIPLSVPVTGENGGLLGTVDAFVRVSDLTAAPLPSVADSGPAFALRDRSTGAWLLTPFIPGDLLGSPRFSWDGKQWVSVQRALRDPAVDLVLASPLDPMIAPFASNARAGAIALAIAAVVVIVVTVLATLRLTRSLSTLAVAADAVAHGDLERKLDTGGPDEVTRVTRAFNTMTENLRRMLRERSQREALAAMGELAGVLAHQVRSPLTAMRLDLQRVESRLDAVPERELVSRAIRHLDRLERAVAGALQMSRSAAANFEIVDVREPLERAVGDVEHEFHARGARLQVETPASAELTIFGDGRTLEQLFSNILLNAVQAVQTGDTARVTARRENGTVHLLVEDTGVGMSRDTLSRVFEPYYSTKPDGIGIGLAVAQRIVAAHSGEIEITSDEGRGTRVAICFPVASTSQ